MKMKLNEAVTLDEKIRRKVAERRLWRGNIEVLKKRRMSAAMVKYIRRIRYSMFITLTFNPTLSPFKTQAEFVRKCVMCIFQNLNSPQEQFYKKFIVLFYLIERHNLSDRVHVHLLVPDIEPILAPRLEWILRTKYCQRSKCGQDWVTEKDEKRIDDLYRKVIGEEIAVYMYRPYRHAGYLGRKHGSDKVLDSNFLRINSRYRGGRPSMGRV